MRRRNLGRALFHASDSDCRRVVDALLLSALSSILEGRLVRRSTTAVLAAFAPVTIAPAVALAAEDAIEVATAKVIEDDLLSVPPPNQLLRLTSFVLFSSKESFPNPAMSPVELLEEPIEMPVMMFEKLFLFDFDLVVLMLQRRMSGYESGEINFIQIAATEIGFFGNSTKSQTNLRRKEAKTIQRWLSGLSLWVRTFVRDIVYAISAIVVHKEFGRERIYPSKKTLLTAKQEISPEVECLLNLTRRW